MRRHSSECTSRNRGRSATVRDFRRSAYACAGIARARRAVGGRGGGGVAELRRVDVLFVSGPGGEAARYRCDHAGEQLELCGLEAAVVYRDEVALERLA